MNVKIVYIIIIVRYTRCSVPETIYCNSLYTSNTIFDLIFL